MSVLYETYRSRSPESSVTTPESQNSTLSRASVTIPGTTAHDSPEYPYILYKTQNYSFPGQGQFFKGRPVLIVGTTFSAAK